MANYKTSISFGLVYIPVVLHASVKSNDISFNMLEKKSMSRVQYKKTCVDCNDRLIKQEDIVKGYQYEKDKYVIFNDKDFEKIKTKKDRSITIESFVKLNEIDPVYFEKTYFVVPEKAEKAFALLAQALEKENKVGIAKTVLGNKETLVALRVRDGQLLLSTMFFEEELVRNPQGKLTAEVSAKELDMAKAIIAGMTDKFKPQEYKDEYRAKLLAAIDQKIAGKQITSAPREKDKPITDLMDALKESLKVISFKKPTKPKKETGKDKAKIVKMKKAN